MFILVLNISSWQPISILHIRKIWEVLWGWGIKPKTMKSYSCVFWNTLHVYVFYVCACVVCVCVTRCTKVTNDNNFLQVTIFLSSAYVVSFGPTSQTLYFSFFHSVSNFCQTPTPTQQNGWVWHENDCANHPTPPPTPHRNFSATSRPARELKFGTDIH